jgi:hypothetical protein
LKVVDSSVSDDVILCATQRKIIFAMSTTKVKSKFLVVRVTDKTRTKFHSKAQRYGNPSDVLREIVEAFNEDRLVIQPPVTRKESLYVTGN